MTPNTHPPTRSISTLVWRALRRRCPVCGEGRVFRNWIRMHANCPSCGYRFEREPGYWLGSIYFNYGLTAVIVTATYFAFYFSEVLPQPAVMAILLTFCVLFPLWFFRFARCIWMAFDVYFDPIRASEQPKSENSTR